MAPYGEIASRAMLLIRRWLIVVCCIVCGGAAAEPDGKNAKDAVPSPPAVGPAAGAPPSAKSASPAKSAPAASKDAAAAPPTLPDQYKLNMLIRTTIIAVNQANKTGNYAVLRDLGSPNF